MPKDKLTDYSSTNASNTDVGGVNIDEGMLPSGVNNAIREVLTHLKNFASGTDGIDVLSLADDTATNAMKIQAPSSVTTTTTLTLPDGDGSENQTLVTDGSGTLSWADLYYGGQNLIINGDMTVAQRGTSSTGTDYQTVDRWKIQNSGGVTQSQEDLTSSDEPYNYGFRKTLKLLNTANASGTSTYTQVFQIIEAQNLASSGWNYTSSSSYITVQFWLKSSLAGTYVSFLRTNDGTSKSYSFEFTLVADTWKKVTYTVSGDSGITIDNDNGIGLDLFIVPYYGTDFTTSGHTDESWQTYDGSNITGDYAQNWKNSTSSTFFITGVKVEIGSTATPFQHESYAENLAKCQRYFTTWEASWAGVAEGSGYHQSALVSFPVHMRATPAVARTGGTNSTRYPSSSWGGTYINTTSFASFITAQSAGGNETWQAIGTANAEL